MKKVIFWIFWLLIIFIGPYVVINKILAIGFQSNLSQISSYLLRLSGVFLFSLLFIQIIIGFYMNKLSQIFGRWIYKMHAIEGGMIYLLMFIHPMFLLIFNFKIFGTLDPFYIYTQACLLCRNKFEYLYTLGRLSLWLSTFIIFAVIIKNSSKWIKENWTKIHPFNIIVFFLVAAHGYLTGSDLQLYPLNYIFCFMTLTVIFTLSLKLLKKT